MNSDSTKMSGRIDAMMDDGQCDIRSTDLFLFLSDRREMVQGSSYSIFEDESAFFSSSCCTQYPASDPGATPGAKSRMIYFLFIFCYLIKQKVKQLLAQ